MKLRASSPSLAPIIKKVGPGPYPYSDAPVAYRSTQSRVPCTLRFSDIFLGLNEAYSSAKFMWSNSENVVYTFGTWEEVPCRYRAAFVCESGGKGIVLEVND